MFNKFFLYFFLLFLFSNNAFSNIDEAKMNKNFDLVKSYLYHYHINNIEMKKWSSEILFYNFVNTIDEDKLIFSEEDFSELDLIDKEFLNVFRKHNKRNQTLNKFYSYYKNKHEESKEIFIDILESFDDSYFSNDFNYKLKNNNYPKNKDEKYIYHKKQFIYMIINYKDDIENHLKELENFFHKEYKPLNYTEFQIKLLHSFAKSLDSHSGVYSPIEFTEFEMKMNNKLKGGIGIVYEINKDGFLNIVQIKENTPASNEEEIEINGIILGVVKQNKKIYFNNLNSKDIASYFHGKSGEEFSFIYKSNIDDNEKIISIIREDIIVDENKLKYKVLVDKKNKYGYLKFDSFYAGNSGKLIDNICFDFYKILQEEGKKIDGLIIDLRNNGGGYLNSSLCMLDYLIPEKYVLSSVNHDKTRITNFNTENKGFVFDKPIIVYINGNSASASEIFAGVIQDYGRGLVIGSRSYGKGTIQRVINLPYGTLKYTSGKFYLPSGRSTQLKGITPDINIPDFFNSDFFGEKSLEKFLPHDYLKTTNFKIKKSHIDKDTKKNIRRKTRKFLKSQEISLIDDFYSFIIYNNYEKDEFNLNYQKMKEEKEQYEKEKNQLLEEIYKKNPIITDHSYDFEKSPNINVDPIFEKISFISFKEILSK